MNTRTTQKLPGILRRTIVAAVVLVAMIAGTAPQADAQTYTEGPDYKFEYANLGAPFGTIRKDWNPWGGAQNIPYYINNAVIAAGFGPAVQGAFATLQNDPGSNISFVYMGTTSATSEFVGTAAITPSDGINVVSFGSLGGSSIGRGGFGGALTVDSNGNLTGAGVAQFDITLSNSTTWAVGAVSGASDVESLVLHELAHAIGLFHPDSNSSAVLWPVLVSGTTKRELHPADKAGLAILYPNSFNDVAANAYYADAVEWAQANGITQGTSATTFSPNGAVTRAQLATFLWRYAGEPAAAGHPFTDVPNGQYYTTAVAWLAQSGITTGTSPTTFSPHDPVTRAQVATFLWRSVGQPSAASSGFSDVANGQYYTTAIGWLSAAGITTGTSATTFSPFLVLDRAQAVTFIHRLAGTP